MKKRNSAVDLTDLAIGLLILGITVFIGVRALEIVRDSRLTELDTVSTSYEDVDMNSSAGVDALTNTWGSSVDVCRCNVSGTGISGALGACEANTTIPAANYTTVIDDIGGAITLVNATETTYNDAECNYTWYNTSRPDFDLPNSAMIGLAEYGNWFDIIVIVGVAGLILALIFMAFGNRGQEGGVVY